MKYLGLIFILISLIAVAYVADLSAHSAVRFHTGQTSSYEAYDGEDADVDGTSKSYTSDGCGAGAGEKLCGIYI
jgi:hypothetical protein